MLEIQNFIKINGSDKLDGKSLEQFVHDRYKIIVQLEQAKLIYREQHRLSIIGPGYMAIESYEQNRTNRNIQVLLLVFTFFSFVIACAAVYISVFGLPISE
jgi:hypothetical protein